MPYAKVIVKDNRCACEYCGSTHVLREEHGRDINYVKNNYCPECGSSLWWSNEALEWIRKESSYT